MRKPPKLTLTTTVNPQAASPTASAPLFSSRPPRHVSMTDGVTPETAVVLVRWTGEAGTSRVMHVSVARTDATPDVVGLLEELGAQLEARHGPARPTLKVIQ